LQKIHLIIFIHWLSLTCIFAYSLSILQNGISRYNNAHQKMTHSFIQEKTLSLNILLFGTMIGQVFLGMIQIVPETELIESCWLSIVEISYALELLQIALESNR